MFRSEKPLALRAGNTLAAITALSAATAATMTATAVGAEAAPLPTRGTLTAQHAGLHAGAGPHGMRISPVTPLRSSATVLYTVKRGDTVSALAHRYGTTVAAIVKANKLNSRALIRIGQTLRITSPSHSSTKPAKPSKSKPAKKASSHKVVSGDTVSALAHRYGTTVSAIISANHLNSNALIRVGQTLRIPGTSAATSKPAKPAKPSTSKPAKKASSHKVVSGDTVSALAHRYGTTVSAIISANHLSSNALIRVGQTLRIPGSSAATSKPAKPAKPSTSKPSSKPTTNSTVTHKVTSGDTVSGLASRYGTTVAAIVKANNLSNAQIIHVGQTLKIPGGLVSNTFLHYTYSNDVTASANANKRQLLAASLPSRSQMREIVRSTAKKMGVDPALALAIAHQESGFDASAVSPANAVGVMQVIPSSGQWASDLVGRKLNLLDPHDNVVAGVAILRALDRSGRNAAERIGGYYQGLGSVQRNGLYSDTQSYVSNVKALMTRYR